jgi:hypothetical protein
MNERYVQELIELFTLGGGTRDENAALVAQIAAGKLRLPRCFTLRNGTPEQTARAHELARLLVAN